ncbi:MAG: hypothetical protein MZU97_07060 [Bacillus subtilis]|nr:hypothetical protein [Bacillus subtilis]
MTVMFMAPKMDSGPILAQMRSRDRSARQRRHSADETRRRRRGAVERNPAIASSIAPSDRSNRI